MDCPIKMFNQSNFRCDPYCAFKTDQGCLLAEGLAIYINSHKPVQVKIEPEEDKEQEISKLINVLQQINNNPNLSNFINTEDWYNIGF